MDVGCQLSKHLASQADIPLKSYASLNTYRLSKTFNYEPKVSKVNTLLVTNPEKSLASVVCS